ncbi:hypothetical protein SK128_023267 [Halocaridina rubra]|uniref:Uncharacterized protein n=1 Tax=Halocaridina rubra TaxID=373956 RepID=A0AAN8WXQ8_HALRR
MALNQSAAAPSRWAWLCYAMSNKLLVIIQHLASLVGDSSAQYSWNRFLMGCLC